MSTLTSPVANLIEVFILTVVVVWALNEADASSSVVMLALIGICVLGGIAGARLAERR